MNEDKGKTALEIFLIVYMILSVFCQISLGNVRHCLMLQRDYGAKIVWSKSLLNCKVSVDMDGKIINMNPDDFSKYQENK